MVLKCRLRCRLSGAPGVTVVPVMESLWDSGWTAWLFKVVIWSCESVRRRDCKCGGLS